MAIFNSFLLNYQRVNIFFLSVPRVPVRWGHRSSVGACTGGGVLEPRRGRAFLCESFIPKGGHKFGINPQNLGSRRSRIESDRETRKGLHPGIHDRDCDQEKSFPFPYRNLGRANWCGGFLSLAARVLTPWLGADLSKWPKTPAIFSMIINRTWWSWWTIWTIISILDVCGLEAPEVLDFGSLGDSRLSRMPVIVKQVLGGKARKLMHLIGKTAAPVQTTHVACPSCPSKNPKMQEVAKRLGNRSMLPRLRLWKWTVAIRKRLSLSLTCTWIRWQSFRVHLSPIEKGCPNPSVPGRCCQRLPARLQ